jgi:homoserine/homoserine lactone efflux protein
MIAWEIWILFVGYAVPMVISPGPGNTLLAASGARFGIAGSVPFWGGFELGNVALCLLYGLSLGNTLHAHPEIHQALKWIGIAYLLYLAWGFARESAASPAGGKPAPRRLGLRDGFLSVLLNPKIHSMILVMYTQLLDPAKPLPLQVAQLTAAFLAVCIACHFPWIYAGKVILGRVASARAMRIQGWVFSACMVLVAAYTAIT